MSQQPEPSPSGNSSIDNARLARGFSVQLVGRGGSILLSVVSIALTVRYLGVDRYGILTAAVVFSGLFDAFSDIGLATVTIRRVTGGRGTLEHLVGLNLSASIIYAGPLWVLASAAGFFVYAGRPQYQLGVAIVASSILLRAIVTCFDPVLMVVSRFGPFALADIVGRVASVLLMIIAVYLDLGLVAFFVIQVVPSIARFVIEIGVARGMGRFRPVFNRGEILNLMREGAPLAAISLIAVTYYRADGIALSLLSSETQVGSYGLGYRVATTLAVIPALFTSTVFAALAVAFAAGRVEFNAFAAKTVQVMTLLAVPVAVFGAIFAPYIIELFASRSAVPVATVAARYLFVASALGFLNAILGTCLLAAHDQRFLLKVSLVALVVNIVLNVGLDARHGAAGAGAALVVTECLSVTMAFARLRHVTGFAVPLVYTARVCAAAGATIAVWLLVRQRGVAVLVPVLGATFLAGLVAAGPLRPAEVRALVRMLRPGRAPKTTTGTSVDESRQT